MIIQDPIYKIPKEILEAAELVSKYAQLQGWEDWELRGIADRNLVSRLRVQLGIQAKKLQMIEDII